MTIIKGYNSAYTGLPFESIKSFSIVLTEDSFLSGKGRRIFRGKLESVDGVNQINCSGAGTVLLIGDGAMIPFFQGERIIVSASLKRMTDSKDLNYIAFARGDPRHLGWSSPPFQWRKELLNRVEHYGRTLTEDPSALFSALYMGNSDRLDGELKDNFRKSGVPHLLALSGFHVAILVLVMTFFLQRLIGRTAAVLISIPFLMLYLFFAGASPSLLRAVLMFVIGGLILCSGGEVTIFQILLFTCFLQLLISPFQGYSLSFQLSYMALAGILILGVRVSSLLQPWLPPFLRLSLSASVGAHIFTAPILIYHFGELYPWGIAASIVITPLITIFMWISLLAFALNVLDCPLVITDIFNKLCELLYWLIDRAVEIFSQWTSVHFSSKGDMAVYLSICSIVVVCLYIQSWRFYGRRKSPQFKLRFPYGNKSSAGDHGVGPEEKMEPEFSH